MKKIKSSILNKYSIIYLFLIIILTFFFIIITFQVGLFVALDSGLWFMLVLYLIMILFFLSANGSSISFGDREIIFKENFLKKGRVVLYSSIICIKEGAFSEIIRKTKYLWFPYYKDYWCLRITLKKGEKLTIMRAMFRKDWDLIIFELKKHKKVITEI